MNDIYDVKGLETPVFFALNETLLFCAGFAIMLGLVYYFFYAPKKDIKKVEVIEEEEFDIRAELLAIESQAGQLGNIEFLQKMSDAFRRYKKIYALSFSEIETKDILSAEEKKFFESVYFDEYMKDQEIDKQQIIDSFKRIL